MSRTGAEYVYAYGRLAELVRLYLAGVVNKAHVQRQFEDIESELREELANDDRPG